MVRTILGVCTSPGMEHSYLVPGGIIVFKYSVLTYILDSNVKERHHTYVQIKYSDILQC